MSKKGYFPNLIDRDDLLRSFEDNEHAFNKKDYLNARYLISKASRVKAIPLDWLEKEADKNTYSDDTLTYAIDLWKGKIENDAP